MNRLPSTFRAPGGCSRRRRFDWRAKILSVRVMGKCGDCQSDILDGVASAAGCYVPGVPANPNVAQVIDLSPGGLDGRTCSPDDDAMLARALPPIGCDTS